MTKKLLFVQVLTYLSIYKKNIQTCTQVFRNETLDATHLAEFHQVEGVIADRGLGLADLIGVLDAFFKRLGFDRLQFKPAYNPYTEPSMEIFAHHTGQWLST